MKLALVCPYNLDFPGGVQEHVKALYKSYKKRGHKVRILTSGYRLSRGSRRGDIIQIGSGASVINALTNDSSGTINFFLDTQDQIKKVLEYEKFDLIHFHSPEVPFLSWQILVESRCANVATFHVAFEKERQDLTVKLITKVVSPIAKSVSLQFDGSIAVSKPAAEIAKNFWGVQPDVIIPNGVDVERFNPKVPPIQKYKDGKINILYVGRLDPRKGVLYLLKAYLKFKDKFPRSRLIIAGSGPQREILEELVEIDNLEDVIFEGFIDDEELPSYYSTADIFCSPAIHGESFGIVLLEAMATGKPVVATNNIGYCGVLTGVGKKGLVPVKNSEALAARLITFMENETLRGKVASWGLKESKKYSWNVISNQIYQFYIKIIRGHKEKEIPMKEKIVSRVKQWLRVGHEITKETIPFYDSIKDTFFDEGEWYKR